MDLSPFGLCGRPLCQLIRNGFANRSLASERQNPNLRYTNLTTAIKTFTALCSNTNGAVFCSSKAALENAYGLGLSKDVTILTRSPALLASGSPAVSYLDTRGKATPEDLEKFSATTSETLSACLRALEADRAMAPFARIVLQTVWIFQMRALCAAFLQDSDGEEPRLILDVALESGRSAAFIGYPWTKLLADNPRVVHMEIPVQFLEHLALRSQTEPILKRLQVRGMGHFARRLYEIVGDHLPDWFFRGDYISINGTELENDIAIALACRLFKTHRFKPPRAADFPADGEAEPLAESILAKVWNIYGEALGSIVPAFTLVPLRAELLRQIDDQLRLYRNTRELLQSPEFSGWGSRPILFTTNYPKDAAFLALTNTLQERGIPLVGMQHGITRELVENPQNEVNYENATTPVLLCLTQRGAELSDVAPFRRPDSRAIHAGLPRAFRNLRRKCERRSSLRQARTILYPQGHTRVGGIFSGAGYRDDRQASLLETRLCQDVFEGLPHPVVFKPYPESAYLDEDPAMTACRSLPNVTIDATGWDMRFMLSDFFAVVTLGATSTLSWIYWSGRPFAYLDPPCVNLRLRSDLVPVFRECASYFDQTDPDHFEALRAWLSRPRETILADWESRKAQREAALAPVFGDTQRWSSKSLLDQLVVRNAVLGADPVMAVTP